jgi:hypothetical protein
MTAEMIMTKINSVPRPHRTSMGRCHIVDFFMGIRMSRVAKRFRKQMTGTINQLALVKTSVRPRKLGWNGRRCRWSNIALTYRSSLMLHAVDEHGVLLVPLSEVATSGAIIKNNQKIRTFAIHSSWYCNRLEKLTAFGHL